MDSFISSPPIRIEVCKTIPLKEMTAISVVPPPISTIIFPIGLSISTPIPIAEAMASATRYTSLAPLRSALSRTARFSTSVTPEGTQITAFPMLIRLTFAFLINSRIITSVASKSAITPSFKGRMVTIS